jgi:hypothetical protein
MIRIAGHRRSSHLLVYLAHASIISCSNAESAGAWIECLCGEADKQLPPATMPRTPNHFSFAVIGVAAK